MISAGISAVGAVHYIASGMDVCAYTNPDASQEDIQKMETENIKWKEIVENLPTVFAKLIVSLFLIIHKYLKPSDDKSKSKYHLAKASSRY